MKVHKEGYYTMSHESGKVEGEGYDMNGKETKKGGDGMGYAMSGGESHNKDVTTKSAYNKGEHAPEANTKGRMKEDRDK